MNLKSSQSQISRFTFFIPVIFAILVCFSVSTAAQIADSKLAELRNQFALNYLKPESHFALAKYYIDKGEFHQAFFIMEYARRHRFEQEDFDTSFVKFFGDNSPEPSDKAKDSFEKAYEFLRAKKTDEAEKLFIKAAELAPKSGMINGWVGRFFFKVKNDNVQALKYYFISYFLDPHAYETEYVESRIRKISVEDIDEKFNELLKSGKSLQEISTDANPLIVSRAMETMAKTWKAEFEKAILFCLENDDSMIRWNAFVTILQKRDEDRDEFISQLLDSNDQRKRGLAAYAVVEFQKEKRFVVLKGMLADKTELVRFDAVSALIQSGGLEGKKIVGEHRKVEKSDLLNWIIDAEFAKENRL